MQGDQLLCGPCFYLASAPPRAENPSTDEIVVTLDRVARAADLLTGIARQIRDAASAVADRERSNNAV